MSEPLLLIGRRDFLVTSALAGAMGALLPVSAAPAATTPLSPAGAKTLPPTRTISNLTADASVIGAAAAAQPAGDISIRPFQFHASDEALADLRRRITATKWPESETVTDATQGVQLATMQKLVDYWAKDYDWRKVEATLSALPQFIINIDGLDIHFIHVRSKHADALPLIVTHGWPGSVIEQLKIIDPLTNPTAHGGSAADGFHLVIPSMPGYGFSGKPTTTGWGPERMGRAWADLMNRLGYTRYVAPGRRLGCVCRRPDGPAGACRLARHSHQHACHRSSGRRQGSPGGRTTAIRPLSRGKARVPAAGENFQAG
jgi:Epoxide hydrolase N terminus